MRGPGICIEFIRINCVAPFFLYVQALGYDFNKGNREASVNYEAVYPSPLESTPNLDHEDRGSWLLSSPRIFPCVWMIPSSWVALKNFAMTEAYVVAAISLELGQFRHGGADDP